MKYRSIILGLAAALFAACAVNESDHSTPAFHDDEVFFATIEDASTRVFVDDLLRVRWNTDDRVSIFNRTTYNRQYRFDGQDGDNSGSFSKVPTDVFVTSNPLNYVYSVYPYNENTRITDDGAITVYLPAEQSYREDTFGLGANTMIAVADDNELMFKNLCGYVTLRLYGTDVSVTSISLKGNRNEPLAGKATTTADVEAAPELQMDASATQEVTLNMDTSVTLGTTAETATTFWLVVPPTTFEEGITLTVNTSDGLQFKKSTTQRLVLARNTRSKMAALEVIPVFAVDNYLTFSSEGTTTLSLANFGDNAPVLYYSTNTVDWTPWDYSELTFTAEQPLYLCGDNPEGINHSWISEGEGVYSNFVAGGSNFSVSGSIMSLLDRLDNLTAIPCEQCFCDLFNGCTLLTAGPELPATTLTTACYNHLFSGCTSLAAAPALPATTLAERCYQGLFRNCISLAEAPELPATTLAYRCYRLMFNNCLSLATAPVLPATTLEGGCYYQMFYGCSNLTAAPELPVTTLAPDCYREMFNNCTGLTTAPELPATTLADNCYYYMFSRCSGLETAPELPATTLAHSCYFCMFYGCTGLTTAPELPATTLAPSCYEAMFYNCTGLTTAPELPAMTLAEACYRGMFSGCSQLNHVICHATDISAPDCTVVWLRDVSETGTFIKAADMEEWPRNASGIPEGWTVQNDDGSPYIERKYLTFTSEGTTTLSLANYGGNTPVVYYSTDRAHWEPWDYSELTFTSDMPLYLCGDNPDGFSKRLGNNLSRSTFTAGGSSFHVSGNVMSLLDPFEEVTVIPSNSCFMMLFNNCTGLLSAPDLPATTLAEYCYSSMFNGCTGLTTAPDLPATTLAEYCYSSMFNGCTGLTTAPDLPATTLADRCYLSMFYRCSSLTTAPDLPATTLADRCYLSMFYRCSSLTTAPELPATTLADNCYYGMFNGCTGLTTAPDLPATTLAESCYRRMFYDCSQLNYVKCLATDISATNCVSEWLSNVASTGTFVKAPDMYDWPTGTSGIPEGWTVEPTPGENLYASGSGVAGDPWIITTPEHMSHISEGLAIGVCRYFKLGADIDMTGIEWTPINTKSPYDRPIDFNGDNHTISNLSCTSDTYASFFGVLYGKCYDVNFVNAAVRTTADGSGILGGYGGVNDLPCEVSRVHVQGSIDGKGKIGGLFGNGRGCVITACSADVVINGPNGQKCGGLVGTDVGRAITIRDSWSAGSIVSTASICGGIVGELVVEGSSIYNCYSTASVTTQYLFGGIVGRAVAGQKSNASNCNSYDPKNHVEKCIAWNTLLKSNCGDASEHYSNGAVVGATAVKNYLAGCIRKPDLDFQDCTKNAELGTYVPFDQEDSDPDHPMVGGAGTYAFAYHGKAAAAGKTVSQVAKDLGWSETVWDLNGDLPLLK